VAQAAEAARAAEAPTRAMLAPLTAVAVAAAMSQALAVKRLPALVVKAKMVDKPATARAQAAAAIRSARAAV